MKKLNGDSIDYAAVCESPIEEEMLRAIIAACWREMEIVQSPWCNDLWIAAMADEQRKRVFIAPQTRFENLRIDIMLAQYAGGIYPRMIAVECDGYDFHKAEHGMVERDAARDERLLKRGIKTMRFSGGRISNNAIRCAREAIAELTREKLDVFGQKARFERRSGAHSELVDDGSWMDV